MFRQRLLPKTYMRPSSNPTIPARLCWQRGETPSQAGDEPLPRERPQARKELAKLRNEIAPDGPLRIGAFVTVEGNGADDIREATVSAKHRSILEAQDGKTSLRVTTTKEWRMFTVITPKGEVGNVDVAPGEGALWKGEVLRILQRQSKGLLVDRLRGDDYDRAMKLEQAEMQNGALSDLGRWSRLTEGEQKTVTDTIREALGVTGDVRIGVRDAPPVARRYPSVGVTVSSAEKPGVWHAVFDVARSGGGIDANISRVHAMNFRPPLEEIPASALVQQVLLLTHFERPLQNPVVTIERRGAQSVIRVSDLGDKGPPVPVAEVTLETASGKLQGAIVHPQR
jgi:hypothetical protein